MEVQESFSKSQSTCCCKVMNGLFVLDRGLHRRESAAKALKRLCMAC